MKTLTTQETQAISGGLGEVVAVAAVVTTAALLAASARSPYSTTYYSPGVVIEPVLYYEPVYIPPVYTYYEPYYDYTYVW